MGNGFEGSDRFVSADGRGHSGKKVKEAQPVSCWGECVEGRPAVERGARGQRGEGQAGKAEGP